LLRKKRTDVIGNIGKKSGAGRVCCIPDSFREYKFSDLEGEKVRP